MPRIRDVLYTWLIKHAAPIVLERAELHALAAEFRSIEASFLEVDKNRESMLRKIINALDELHALDARVKSAVTVLAAAERMLIDTRIQSPEGIGDAVAVGVIGMVGRETPLVPPASEAVAC